MSVNKTTLLGHIGKDAELRRMPSGKPVANFRLATTEKWKDGTSGEVKERTEWHTVVFYDRLAEVAFDYCKKGRQVYVEGRLHYSTYEKDGVKRDRAEIIGFELQLLGSKPNGGAGNAPSSDAPAEEDQGNDIPF